MKTTQHRVHPNDTFSYVCAPCVVLLVCLLSGSQLRAFRVADRWHEVPLIAPTMITVWMAMTPQLGDHPTAIPNRLQLLEIGNRSGDLGDGVPEGQGSGTRFGWV